MTDENVEIPSPRKNRITLDQQAKAIVDGWRNQLEGSYRGISISDAELVNWLVSTGSPKLSAKQCSEIQEVFFDEIKQLEWQLAQAKMARSQTKMPLTQTLPLEDAP